MLFCREPGARALGQARPGKPGAGRRIFWWSRPTPKLGQDLCALGSCVRSARTTATHPIALTDGLYLHQPMRRMQPCRHGTRKAHGDSPGRSRGWIVRLAIVLTVVLSACGTPREDEGLALLNRADIALREFRNGRPLLDGIVSQARAVAVFPDFTRGGLLLGGEGGNGVVLRRDEAGSWSAPTFVGMGGVSYGFQVGYSSHPLLFVFKSDDALNRFMSDGARGGLDSGFGLFSIGGIADLASDSFGGDTLVFSNAKGLYFGANLKVGATAQKSEWTRLFCDDAFSSREILFDGKCQTTKASRITSTLDAMSGGHIVKLANQKIRDRGSANSANPPRPSSADNWRRRQVVATAPALVEGEDAVSLMKSEPRHALVVGIGKYKSLQTLRNPSNDARAVRDALARLDFKVAHLEEASRSELVDAIDGFSERLRGGGVGVFFYAGHGIQVRGQNYLLPADADPRTETEVEGRAINTSYLLQHFADAGNRINVMILDACRDNPLRSSTRSATRGLAVVGRALGGTLIAYATAPDSVALDGDAGNGLFTAELLRHIETPGLPVEGLFKRVTLAVRQVSGGNQVPWISGSLEGDFYFKLPTSVGQ